MTRIAALLLTAATLTGCAATTGPTAPSPGHATTAHAAAPTSGPTATSIDTLLAKVRVTPTRPNPAGYDRTCGTGHGCVFGKPWADVDHNHCDTRNDVLARQMTGITKRAGSNCIVITGTLADPYTGRTITWTKAHASAVQLDHIVPLAYAWDMGADGWTQKQRTEFANDQTYNLLAVDGHANQAKSDSGPGEWLPINKAYRCEYLARFLVVATHYGLPITKADADSIKHTAAGCTNGGTK
jgi:hypothetical protein